jgi:hypothetical protein
MNFPSPVSNPHGKIFLDSTFSFCFGWSLCKSAKFQLFISCRTGLAFWTNIQKKIPSPIQTPRGKIFRGFRFFPSVLVVPLYGCQGSVFNLMWNWVSFLPNIIRLHSHFRHPRGNISWVSNFFFWFGWSAMFQLYTSSTSGLAFIWKTYKKNFIPQFRIPGANF